MKPSLVLVLLALLQHEPLLTLHGPLPASAPLWALTLAHTCKGATQTLVKAELSKALAGLGFKLLEHGQQCRNVPHGEIKALVAGPMQSLL